MKTKIIIVILVAMALGMTGGCNQQSLTPRQELYLTQITFRDTINILYELKEAGKFDADEIDRIKTLINSGERLLEKWTDAVIAGTPTTTSQALEAVIDELMYYKLKGQQDE